MSIADRLTVSRHIAAPADCIFAIVTDPRAHVAIDGSGMLVATDHATPLRAVGDTFEMDMDRAPLGDIPLDRYRVTNTVVAIVAGVEVAWTTGGLGQPSVGHVWGYHLVPVGDAATQVDHYCDWSAVSAESRERYVRRLLVPRPQPWPVVRPKGDARTLAGEPRTHRDPDRHVVKVRTRPARASRRAPRNRPWARGAGRHGGAPAQDAGELRSSLRSTPGDP